MNTQSPDNTYYCTLTQRGLMTLTGPDAAKFLQGQVTCDVRELTQPTTRLGAQCNLKGRVMANFRALQKSPETIALYLARDLIPDTIASLNKYIVFSKAKLEDSSNQYVLIGVYGKNAQQLVADYFGQTPSNPGDWIGYEDSLAIKLDDLRYECWMTHAAAREFAGYIATNATEVNQALWDLLDIHAGIAWVTQATRELFTPQALNYELINAVSFRKGCYTGQEIVARMHYRGKLKRHTYRYQTSGDLLPLPGSHVYASPNDSPLGEVVSAAFNGEGEIELLASINGELTDGLYLANNPEKLKRLALPYAIPSGEETPSNT